MSYIGFAGQLRVGKDTSADYIKGTLNEKLGSEYWRRDAFASSLKKYFCDLFDLTLKELEEWKVKDEIPEKLDIPMRVGLKNFGEGMRQIKSSIWIDLVFRDGSPKIISDVRYINELIAIKNKKGFNVLVINPNRVNYDDHPSEAALRPLILWAINNKSVSIPNKEIHKDMPYGMEFVDYILWNDGTLEDLYMRINERLVPVVSKFSFVS